jgi:hypothetical protein
MASLTAVVGLAGSVAVAGLLLNGFVSSSPSNSVAFNSAGERNAGIAAVGKANVVRVTGEDFSFDAPDEIPAGLTEFRFLNKGPALHHMAILKLEDGKTFDDMRALLAKPGPAPAWIREIGGPNAPAPGLESNATLILAPGNYALICFVDLGGPPHFMKGMVKPLRVVPATEVAVSKPDADVTATLFDYNFKLSSPVTAGTRTIRVYNAAKQHHELELVQLEPGKTLGDMMSWLQKMDGQPPGKALGGIAGVEGGASEYFTADFAPGNYALICFVPDAKDGKPHFMHGMMQEISVK